MTFTPREVLVAVITCSSCTGLAIGFIYSSEDRLENSQRIGPLYPMVCNRAYVLKYEVMFD